MAPFPSVLFRPPPGKLEEERRKEGIKAVTFFTSWDTYEHRGHAGTRDPTSLLPLRWSTVVASAAPAAVPGGSDRAGQSNLFVGETRSVRSTPDNTLRLN